MKLLSREVGFHHAQTAQGIPFSQILAVVLLGGSKRVSPSPLLDGRR
jgi:hypothetical protein